MVGAAPVRTEAKSNPDTRVKEPNDQESSRDSTAPV